MLEKVESYIVCFLNQPAKLQQEGRNGSKEDELRMKYLTSSDIVHGTILTSPQFL